MGVAVAGALRARIEGEVDDSARRRAEYSSDASNYRVPPAMVVFPRSDADVSTTLEFARAEGLSVTARGGGTSVAGNAVGSGIVLDFSRHLNAVLELDPQQRTARVQPGVVLAALQRTAAPHGLRFGPDPSTQTRCTLGGMIGNNACGPRAVAWGRTSDNVVTLRVLDGTGALRTLGPGLAELPGAAEFAAANLAVIRTELGRFDRQGSGYALEHLLPERDPNLARAYVGSEGTCGLLLEAEVRLAAIPAGTALVVLGYPDLAEAADDITALMAATQLPQGAISAVEGIDARLVEVVRSHGRAVPELPRGEGWLFVETTGTDVVQAISVAKEVAAGVSAVDSRVVTDPAAAAALWRIRADGAGLAGRTPGGEPAWPGWEDAAVPPRQMGAYLRDFEELTREHKVDGLLYGHLGDGCVHVRLDLPIIEAPQRFRAFLLDAADLVARHGGSLCGEHGDGRARSELLTRMYSQAALAGFAGFKALFDPDNLLNPGVLVDPARIDTDLRLGGLAKPEHSGGFALAHDRGDLAIAAHRCVGVGKCRVDTPAATGFMCPSYRATRDEKDSTRGRARVLQEALQHSSLLSSGWRSPELIESLDLCLSCKACGTDCPTGVDMASYKSEVLYRRYRGRLRPIGHYALGQLPRWLRLAKLAPRLVNAAAGAGPLRRFGMRMVGIDPRRQAPALARESFRAWFRRRPAVDGTDTVMLWADTFTDAFTPAAAAAAVELIESLGYRVRIPERTVCCGLTWISTGQLDGARDRLRDSLAALAEHVSTGGLVVGLEPSCTAVLRSDLVELLPDDPRSARVAAATRTLAEFLTAAPNWQPPSLDGVSVLVQPHCHQHAVLGFGADRALLEQAGATVTELSGCCGLAGNFGMEQGHYDVSVAVAETALLPALRATPEGAVILADGFSCRTQIEQLAGRRSMHLAQLLVPGKDRVNTGDQSSS